VSKLARLAEQPATPVASDASENPKYDYSPALVTLAAPLSRGAEAIRALRTHVLTQHVQAGRRALAVCGPSLDVGCTFVAANLAVALAQVGIKTLLVDADLRAPMIDQIIRPKQVAPGLSACLAAPSGHVDDFIDNAVFPNLSVFYAGSPASNAQELLAREWFEEVMNHCLREYEITIVDTPPANTCADVRRISNLAGYGMVVARKNRSMVGDVRTLVEQLLDDHVRVIGTVMNAD
jgi:protein-tyrosine kinase